MKTTVAKAGGLHLDVVVWQPVASEDWCWAVDLLDANDYLITRVQSGSRVTEKAARRAALKAADAFACKLVKGVNKALYEEGM